jgi:hypothetical protein
MLVRMRCHSTAFAPPCPNHRVHWFQAGGAVRGIEIIHGTSILHAASPCASYPQGSRPRRIPFGVVDIAACDDTLTGIRYTLKDATPGLRTLT